MPQIGYLMENSPNLLDPFDGWSAVLSVASIAPHQTAVFRFSSDRDSDEYYLACINCHRVETNWRWSVSHLDVFFRENVLKQKRMAPKWLEDLLLSGNPFCDTIIEDIESQMRVLCYAAVVLDRESYKRRFKNTPPFGLD